MIESQKFPVELWCLNCKNKVRDNARNTWYCQKIATLITQAIWCTTWRCSCIWHSSAKESSDKVLFTGEELRRFIHMNINCDGEEFELLERAIQEKELQQQQGESEQG